MSLFDDFLASTEASIPTHITEESPRASTDTHHVKKESGLVTINTNNQGPPIFSLQQVQFQLPAKLVHMVVQNNILAALLENYRILRIDLDNPLEIDVVEISRKPSEDKVVELFMDPTGRHIIVTTQHGENYYLFQAWKRTKELVRLKGMRLTSIAWNKLANRTSSSTREILLGTQKGEVFETCLEPTDEFFRREEKYLILLFMVDKPITGLHYERFPSDRYRYLVMISTPTRLYHLVGTVGHTLLNGNENTTIDRALFEPIFSQYQHNPEFLELPSDLQYSEMLFFNRFPELELKSVPQSFVWLNGAGIYHGDLNFTQSNTNQMIVNAKLQSFPATSYDENSNTLVADIPISIAITEFHYILLYKDYVRAICRLNEKIMYEESISLNENEIIHQITVDNVQRTYWIYTSYAMYELVIKDEERDVWKLYLHKKDYTRALQYCKLPEQKTTVYTAQAGEDFNQRRYMESAKYFAKSAVPFEEVALKFTEKKEKNALRYFLISRLDRLKLEDRTQKTLISTWLVGLYLNKMNQLEDKAASSHLTYTSGTITDASRPYRQQYQTVKDEFRTFLETYGEYLHIPTTYKLIYRYGRNSELFYYANYIGDYEKVIDHWISEKKWDTALKVLNEQGKAELFYKYSTLLIDYVPEKLIDVWMNHSNLNPRYLIPALLRYNHVIRADISSENQAIRYLSYIVSTRKNTDTVIHNFLLTMYATQPVRDETALLTYLRNEGRDKHYELDYALRICTQNGRTQSCVHIYGQMELYEEAVNLALEHHDLDLARINADKPEDDDLLRKRLWVNIAKYVIQNNKDIKTAMQFLKKCDLLKMEDILPFFPDYVLIDDFKDEICSALGEYNVTIEELKSEMDNATISADHIRLDVRKLRKRLVVVEEEQMCSICEYPLLTRQFYVFPCNHQFHADCLISKTTKYLPTGQIKRLADIQEQLSKEFKAFRHLSPEEEKPASERIEKLRHDLDDIVAQQCIFCGDNMIKSIHLPFITEEDADIVSSWMI
ncbi:Pep3/Vps18/deep orange family-domain-containing protein [Pilobolus umbonatus]|nr:Pep3/Vps18/deep orange family-domain-containing protein [Pilobolus umbonatus]